MSKPKDLGKLKFALYPHPEETFMYLAAYKNGKWENGSVIPYQNLSLSPAANVLNYGQGIFEGMKAYRSAKNNIVMFRPEENAKRFASSCVTMAIPEFPVAQFMDAVKQVVKANAAFVPESPDGSSSLYLRPVAIGSEAQLGVKAAKEYLFYIYVSPVGPYYEGVGTVDLIVTNKHRAAPHGTGHAKAVCNYAGSMAPGRDAIAAGYSGILYLDAKHDKYVEEAGAANFFALMKDNTLVTPQLGSILPGITRASIMRFASEEYGLTVEERLLSIDEVCNNTKECFVCGTGAIVTSVNSITWNGKRYNINNNDFQMAHRVYDDLIGIQLQKRKDSYNWVTVIQSAD